LPGAGGGAFPHFYAVFTEVVFELDRSGIEPDEAVFVRFESVTFFPFAEHMSRFLATLVVPERVFLEKIIPVHLALVRTPVSGAQLGMPSAVSISRKSIHFRPVHNERRVDDCRFA
jgi:hypothetical protein